MGKHNPQNEKRKGVQILEKKGGEKANEIREVKSVEFNRKRVHRSYFRMMEKKIHIN